MLYREIKSLFFSQIHTENINTLCGQNVELLNVKLVVNIFPLGSKFLSSGKLRSDFNKWGVCHKPVTQRGDFGTN
jgi:hypothetical protein